MAGASAARAEDMGDNFCQNDSLAGGFGVNGLMKSPGDAGDTSAPLYCAPMSAMPCSNCSRVGAVWNFKTLLSAITGAASRSRNQPTRRCVVQSDGRQGQSR